MKYRGGAVTKHCSTAQLVKKLQEVSEGPQAL